MGLAKYKQKRSFKKTPEPKGKASKRKGALRFVIQKHAATRLHYDFRIELGGVMKSWAVPKGPSLSPSDKRLAMMVEDHPIDYNKFEGVIPKDNYGAGTVMIWDRGTYKADGARNRAESEKLLRAGLKKGDVKITLKGEKLKGSFALVKMHGRGENSWLLIKHGDQHAGDEDVTKLDYSVVSGRTMEEIAEGVDEKRVWRSSRSKAKPIKIKTPVAGKTSIPHDVKPMLAVFADAPFDKKDWLFEVKWDGYRAVAELDDEVKLYSRNLQNFNEKYPPVVDALAKLGHQAVIDGEVVVVDGQGRSRFQLLQRYGQTGEGENRLVYYAFDLLYLDGHDLRDLPLSQRKELLTKLIPDGTPHLAVSQHVEAKGKAFYEAAQRQGLEGIIAKNVESPYRTGRRSRDWLKLKTKQRQEAVICGFTEPRGSRKKFGALVLGVYSGSELKYIGHTGTGFNQRSLDEIFKKLKPLIRKSSPFTDPPKTNTPVTWVSPKLVCEVEFAEWTDEGHLRHPAFIGLREDKSATKVRREVPQPAEAVTGAPKQRSVKVGSKSVPVTHLDKVFWPKDGYTKGDLIAYYRDMASQILPYLKQRPQSLNRHPNGIDGQSFYQKDFQQNPPDWVDTAKIYSESNQKEMNWLLCNNAPSLVYLANLGCIELNPWHSRVGSLEKPDFLLIDIDAKTAPFEQVIEAARQVHQVLGQAGVTGYPKTSGKTGLHVCVPLAAKYDYEQAKQFTELIVSLVHQRMPKTTSLERKPEKREKKIYLDFLQNRKGQTMAAPYCLRPVPGATVSTPLEWSEVRKGLDPHKFTIKTIAKRIERKGDLWKPVLGRGANLEKALKKLGG